MIEWQAWDDSARARVSRGVHAMRVLKRFRWPVCARCGLIGLKNEVSRRALKSPCVVLEDSK